MTTLVQSLVNRHFLDTWVVKVALQPDRTGHRVVHRRVADPRSINGGNAQVNVRSYSAPTSSTTTQGNHL